jgi:hypothetical protein
MEYTELSKAFLGHVRDNDVSRPYKEETIVPLV